jgi:hypothetical protein
MTELCKLMMKFGSDKGPNHHNYTKYYDRLFCKKRHQFMSIFELGLGIKNPGASIMAWKSYFFNSFIYGADIKKDILFEEHRIKTFFCDQNDPVKIKNMWNNNCLRDIFFDLIVEDADHNFQSNLCFMNNSIHKLKIGGYYICEDLNKNTLNFFKEILDQLNKSKEYKFKIVHVVGPNSYDNNLLVAKRKKVIML